MAERNRSEDERRAAGAGFGRRPDVDAAKRREPGYGRSLRFGRLAALPVLLVLCLIAAGCRYTAAPADLLQKPAIADNKQRLVQAIEDTLPAYSKLALPLRDDRTEAVRMVDIDGDGAEEAVVSYYNEFNAPQLMVFQLKDGSWQAWATIEQPLARQLDWLRLEDFDRDGSIELAVGWLGNGSFDSPNMLEMYAFDRKPVKNEYGNTVLEPEASMPYMYADAGDVNGDGRIELAVITAAGNDEQIEFPEYSLTLYDWTNDALQQRQKLDLPSDVTMYDRIVIGKVSERKSGLVVEAGTGAHSSYTFLYVWENGKLKRVPQGAPEEEPSWAPVMNKDIDGDGIIELAKLVQPPGHPDQAYADIMWVTRWVQWDGAKGYKKVLEEYSNYSYSFRFEIPDNWTGHYTISAPEEQDKYGAVVFQYWDPETNGMAELAELYVVPQQQWDGFAADRKDRELTVMETGGGLVYAMALAESSPEWLADGKRRTFEAMRLTADQARKRLSLLPDNE